MRCGCPAGAKTEWHRCSGKCHLDAARCSPSRAAVTAPISRPLAGVMSRESGVGIPYSRLPWSRRPREMARHLGSLGF
jgi:hypothetical protein